MTIYQILEEIRNEPSTNQKMVLLSKYKTNETLKHALYLAESKRVKFYTKTIPSYTTPDQPTQTLDDALKNLKYLSNRTYTGYEGTRHLYNILKSVSWDDASVIEMVVLKDLKLGMGTTNINKVIPKLIETTPYMGAKSYDIELVQKIFNKDKWAYSQLKVDGRYANAIIRYDGVELISRAGEPTFSHNIEDSMLLPIPMVLSELYSLLTFTDSEIVLTGELTINGISERKISNGLLLSLVDIYNKLDIRTSEETDKKVQNFISTNKQYFPANFTFVDVINSIRYTAWDIIEVPEYYEKFSPVLYKNRFKKLSDLLSSELTTLNLIETKIVKNVAEAKAHFKEFLSQKLEGTILKSPNNVWKDGKPNTQIKFKLEITVDLQIVGFNWGTGKNAGFISSLKTSTSDGILNTDPAGLSEKDMEYITNNQEKLLGTIVEVKCSGLSYDATGNYALLHPVFLELRPDKNTANSFDEVVAINNMAMTIN